MRLIPTRKQWNGWSLPSKLTAIGTLIGVISFGFFCVDKTFQFRDLLWKPTHCVRIPIFRGERHLGDNVYARVGGVSLPIWDDPNRQKDDDLIFYDKREERFLSSWGAPKAAQVLARHYSSRFAKCNLGAYANVMAIRPNPTLIGRYPGDYVQIDYDTCLIWRENEGNYYQRYAPFARVVTTNLYKELFSHNIDPTKVRIKTARVVISGLHGGKRQDQDENIEVIVNGKIHKIGFESRETRNEEVIAMELPTDELALGPTMSMSFCFIVLPFCEQFPLPPPESKYPKIGPAHFRDVEIGDTILEIVYEDM